jgi:hypothetical protein
VRDLDAYASGVLAGLTLAVRRGGEKETYGMPKGRRKTGSDVLLKSAEIVGWALGGLEREITQTRERLAALTAQAERLRARAGSSVRSFAATTNDLGASVRRRGRMTAEGRKRISEMMKKRWAEAKKKNRNHL